MNAWFRQLFTVAITNSYYGTIPSDDFDFIVPADTARRLAGAKLVARASGDRLNVLYAAEDTVAGEALIPAPGTVLRFGLRLKNLKFQNFTEVAFDPKVAPPVYRNLTLPAALDAPTPTVILAGSVLSHTLTDATRPVTVYLRDSATVLPTATLLRPGFSIDQLEHSLIHEAIARASGNKTEAAKMLGITRRRLYSRLKSMAGEAGGGAAEDLPPEDRLERPL
jgi:hypothetical protein